jgi:poly-gamma-glutamate synthesis protein (capsule biosynthesis protein)
MVDIAVGGACLIRRRFSDVDAPAFSALVDILRKADVAFTHVEGTICEANSPEAYPTAEAGWTWIRVPAFFANELKWAGYDLVSHASNHAMDFMYGGLYSTWQALKDAGIPYAGTGRSLAQAREAAIVEKGRLRFGMISASSSTANWARAGDSQRGDQSRPGINQLRVNIALDPPAMDAMRDLSVRIGRWVTNVGDDLLVSPPGLHNTVTRYVPNDKPGIALVADEDDVKANLQSIREAKARADLVMFHLHNHEWEPGKDLSQPADFVRDFARRCIDAGADIFLAEGAHAMLRGVEIYKNKPIFYDPGDLFKDGSSKTRDLSERYWMQGRDSETAPWRVVTFDSVGVRDQRQLPPAFNPPGGYNTGRVLAVLVPVCRFDEKGVLQQVTLYPAKHLKGSDAVNGLPGLVQGEDAREIIEYVNEISADFGTTIRYANGVGVVELPQDIDQ